MEADELDMELRNFDELGAPPSLDNYEVPSDPPPELPKMDYDEQDAALLSTINSMSSCFPGLDLEDPSLAVAPKEGGGEPGTYDDLAKQLERFETMESQGFAEAETLGFKESDLEASGSTLDQLGAPPMPPTDGEESLPPSGAGGAKEGGDDDSDDSEDNDYDEDADDDDDDDGGVDFGKEEVLEMPQDEPPPVPTVDLGELAALSQLGTPPAPPSPAATGGEDGPLDSPPDYSPPRAAAPEKGESRFMVESDSEDEGSPSGRSAGGVAPAADDEDGDDEEDGGLSTIQMDSEWNFISTFCFPLGDDRLMTKEQQKVRKVHIKKLHGFLQKKDQAVDKMTKWADARVKECYRQAKADLDLMSKSQAQLEKQQAGQHKHDRSSFTKGLAEMGKQKEKAKHDELKAWKHRQKLELEQNILQLKIDYKKDKPKQKAMKKQLEKGLELQLRQHPEYEQLALRHEVAEANLEQEGDMKLTQCMARQEMVVKGLLSRQDLEQRHHDNSTITKLQNLGEIEKFRQKCVEQFRPIVTAQCEEKEALDEQTMEKAYQAAVLASKKRQVVRRKQEMAVMEKKKKVMAAEHKQTLKQIGKGSSAKEKRQAEKSRFEAEVQAFEKQCIQDIDDKDQTEDEELLDEHNATKKEVRSRWEEQKGALMAKIDTLVKPRPIHVGRTPQQRQELQDMIDGHRREVLGELDKYHGERTDLLRAKQNERINLYVSNCQERRKVLQRHLEDFSSLGIETEAKRVEKMLVELGAKEEQYRFELEQVLKAEAMIMKNETEEVEHTFRRRNDELLDGKIEIPPVEGAPTPRFKIKEKGKDKDKEQ